MEEVWMPEVLLVLLPRKCLCFSANELGFAASPSKCFPTEHKQQKEIWEKPVKHQEFFWGVLCNVSSLYGENSKIGTPYKMMRRQPQNPGSTGFKSTESSLVSLWNARDMCYIYYGYILCLFFRANWLNQGFTVLGTKMRISLHRNEIGLIYFLFFFVSYSSND